MHGLEVCVKGCDVIDEQQRHITQMPWKRAVYTIHTIHAHRIRVLRYSNSSIIDVPVGL